MCIFERNGHTFIQEDDVVPNAQVIAATHENLGLLASIDLSEDRRATYVCSQNILPPECLMDDDPKATLAACRSAFSRSQRIGGPRKLTENEQAAFSLASTFRGLPKDHPLSGELGMVVLDPLLRKHPAWKGGLGFATGDAGSMELALVLAEICDLMRFAGGFGRMKDRLRKFFRIVTSENVVKLSTKQADSMDDLSPSMMRLACLVRAWGSPSFVTLPPSVIPQIPHAFLYRERKFHEARFLAEGIDKQRAVALGIYRATLRFLDFIQFTWLHGLGFVKFDPSRFFLEFEADAFTDYMSRISE
jgi:hypothetical protein